MTTIHRLAIVNRGEPAMRCISAVAERNRESSSPITTIALYTEPDASSWFVREASEAILLGPAYFADAEGHRESRYLDLSRLMTVLAQARADAVWVGWGLVAESAEFARLCERAGITFIGPGSDVIALLGDKVRAKQLAESVGVPVVPWSGGPVHDAGSALLAAGMLGYPVLVKAAAGGGGRGIRAVESASGMRDAFASAQAEAERAFGDRTVFIERKLEAARHVEVQIMADSVGTVWAVGIRDCSIQRRNQKVIEESACTLLDDSGEKALCDAAVRLCAAAGYRSAGTVEFLVDRASKQFLFMEVNARLQVEHPVTELTTGLDLVKLQLDIAQGAQLTGSAPPVVGHAIEARIYAEDPERAFAPAPGRVSAMRLAGGPGIRIDAGVVEGDEIAPEFDSMIAKVVAWGRDRREALSRLHRGLAQSLIIVDGGTTNKGFLVGLVGRPEVSEGSYDNQWLDRLTAAGEHLPPQHPVALLAAAIEASDADQAADQANFYSAAARGRPELPDEVGHRIELSLGGNAYRMRVYCTGRGDYRVDTGDGVIGVSVEHLGRYERAVTCLGRRHRVVADTQGPRLIVEVDGVPHVITRDGGGRVLAPAPAFVVAVLVTAGDAVRAGDPLVVVESMKMETAIAAPFPGTVHSVSASVNTQVEAGAQLVELRPSDQLDGKADTTIRLDLSAALRDSSQNRPDQVGNGGLATIRGYLLGYDLDEDAVRELGGLPEEKPDADQADPGLLGQEMELLATFATITTLARREPDDTEAELSRSAEAYLFAYLACLDQERCGLPEHFLTQLRDALARYGVTSLRRTPELEQALLRLYRSLARIRIAAPVIMAILDRWLHRRDALLALMTDEHLVVIDRLIACTQGRHPDVCDLAREVRFNYVDAPTLARMRLQVYGEMEQCLDELAACPAGERIRKLTRQIVSCPQPMRALLRDRYRDADATTRVRLLQARASRFYRFRGPREMRCEVFGRHLTCLARYQEGGQDALLVAGYVPLDDLADFAGGLRAFLSDQPADRRVVVDVESWRTGEWVDAEPMAAELARLLGQADFGHPLHRLDITITGSRGPDPQGQAEEHLRTLHFTFTQDGSGFTENPLYRNLHPMIAQRLDLWRLSNFTLERMSSAEYVYLFHAVAKENPKDERLIAIAEVRDLTPARDSAGGTIGFPHLEGVFAQALADVRHALSRQPVRQRPLSNRVILHVLPTWDIAPGTWRGVAHRLAPMAAGLGIEKVSVRIRAMDAVTGESGGAVLDIANVADRAVTVRLRQLSDQPIRPLTEYRQKVLRSQRLEVPYPYELVRMLTPPVGAPADFPAGVFAEYDLDDSGDHLVPVDRPYGGNLAGIVVGVITNFTPLVPEGMRRVAILGDPTSGLGNLAEPECRRILAALALASQIRVPVEWFALSSGARIAWDSGTENMDWIAAVLRRLIELTQSGGEVNVVVTGINVGAQPYWNAEATMLMHTSGILVMTPASAMVLTGKSSLDYSGGVSAEDNFGIGGFDRIMGPNGQGQYWAPTLAGACALLLRHYENTYIVPGETCPRRAPTSDPYDRDVCASPHKMLTGSAFDLIGDIFSAELNGERKKPFDMRSLMHAVADADHDPFERWARWRDAENAIAWDARIGGIPVCLIGIESQSVPRTGFVPADGPPSWTSGTLFPQSSRKVARAVNAASGNRPVVVLANLSGFDGSPESMRNWQLEYGAEIGRAVTNFRGPIVFVVVSRYHGGAFVVFSKRLHEDMDIAAVAGSYASVIGGAPAAAVVFAREVSARTEQDERVLSMRGRLAAEPAGGRAELRQELAGTIQAVRAEKLGQVADEFDGIHDIQRAMRVGSVDHIIPAAELRPFIIGALERRLALAAPVTATQTGRRAALMT